MRSKIVIYSGNNLNPNFYYHSGLELTYAFLILDGKRKTIITNILNRGFRKEFAGRFVIANDIFAETKKIIGKNFSIDGAMPFRVYKKISNKKEAKDATEMLYNIRLKKKNEEVAKIRKAARATIGIIEKFSRCKGKKEEEVAKEILKETYKSGLEPAFLPIVATGSNAATPHARCTKKIIEDYVLIDYGVKYKNYCADITRCYFFHSAKANKLKEKYEKLKNLEMAIIDRCGEMKKSKEITDYYENINTNFGFPKPLHAIGHGIGLEVHEYPRFGKKYNDDIVQTTFTIEPAIYLKNYGLRYENTVYHNGKRIVRLE